jgi:hypothetical protein
MTRQAIKNFAIELEIPYLVHFTRVTNLPSIMEHGIYPIAQILEIGDQPEINDQLRLDDRLNGTSISIAHPNCQMLYKYRMQDESVDWAVLVLKKSILWQKECAFCRHNAADTRISQQPIEALTTEVAFRGMFDEIDGFTSREEQKLKVCDPTDVQAEVMVFDIIEPEYIRGIVFNSKEAKDAYSHLLTEEQKAWLHAKNKGLFGTRSYSRLYS